MSGKTKKEKTRGPAKSVSSLSAKKQRCARSYAGGQARKQLRREVQEAAHARNIARKARGELTPWQAAKAAARARKAGSNISSIERAALADPIVMNAVRTARQGNRESVRAAKRKGAGSGD
jgi:hypothetical protein